MRTALLALAVSIPFALPARADETVPDLVRTLGADDFEARERAHQRLLDLAAEDPGKVLPHLPADDPDPEVASFLHRLRKAVPWERDRRRALEACRGDAKLIEPVEAAYRDITPEGVVAAAAALGRRQDAALPVLAPFLRHPDPAVRLSAAQSLAPLKRRGTADRLLPLLRDPFDEVRAAAALGIGQCGGSAAAAGELVKLFHDPVSNVRVSAIMAFNFTDDRSAHPEIAKLLGDPDDDVRRHALEALGGAERSLAPEIEQALTDPDPYIQSQAALLLARMIGKDAAPKIAQLLDSTRAGTQTTAIQILGTLRDGSFAPRILPFVDQDPPHMRIAAIHALAEMKAASAASRIAQRLGDENLQVRAAAASALGALDDPAYAAPLARALLKEKDGGFLMIASTAFIRLTKSPWRTGEPDFRKRVEAWLATQPGGTEPAPPK